MSDNIITGYSAREREYAGIYLLDNPYFLDNEFDYYIHMSMAEGRRIADRFAEKGLLKEDAMLYYTHFSHNGKMIYDDLVKAAKSKYGFKVAYDGLTITL